MSKRKRDSEDSEDRDIVDDQALRIRISRLKAKIDQGNKSLVAALKLSRGFERQKLGRRQKAASSEPHSLLRLREEVIFLKQLDLAKTGQNHLLKQLFKTKRIRESAAFVNVYGLDLSIENVKSGAEANVIGRLFNSQPVKKVMPEIMTSIYHVLGIKEGKLEKAPKATTNKGSIRKEDQGVEEDHLHAGTDGLPEDVETESNTTDQEQSSDELGVPMNNEQSKHSKDRLDSSLSPSTFPNPIDSSQQNSEDETSPPPTTKPPQLSKTAFLPSLTMGGYYSGSESDYDQDDEAQYSSAQPPQLLQRKNRRGQRARQQLAELKFGKNAKHLLKQQQNQNQLSNSGSRDSGWDPKRGAVGTSDARGRGGNFRQTRTSGSRGPRRPDDAVRMENTTTPATTQRRAPRAGPAAAERPLHPSWEAAKQRKAQGGAGLVAFSGRKTTFE